MKRTINIDLLVGLPGSGKTHYAANSKVTVISFDEQEKTSLENVLCNHYMFAECFKYHWPQNVHMVFDGLFTSKKSQEKIIEEWISLCNKYDHQQLITTNIKFIYFNGDRETCLHNDSFREGSRRAALSIKNLPLDKPVLLDFQNKYTQHGINFSYEEKEIFKVTYLSNLIQTHGNRYWSEHLGRPTLVSERWCTGGCVCCWDGSKYESTPETAPTSFKELDQILESICPNITFLQYKKLFDACVTVEEDSEADYYGGKEYYNLYCCDLTKLYEMLKESGYINENERKIVVDVEELVLDFETVGGPFGDCTCSYKVTTNSECTVREVINKIITRNGEYGTIRLLHGNRVKTPHSHRIEYKYGQFVGDPEIILGDQQLNMNVVTIFANGGWSCMNYDIIVK
jgi:hypothetical protein